MSEFWGEDREAPAEVFIPYDRTFIRKVVMGAAYWGRCPAIAIALKGDWVPTDARVVVSRKGTLVHAPNRESLVNPLVVINSEVKALTEAAMELASRLGCPACEMWPESQEIIPVMIVEWARYGPDGRRIR